MTLTAMQQMVVDSIGDTDPPVLSEPRITTLWDNYANLGALDPQLQFQAVRRDAIDLLLGAGQERLQVDVTTPNLAAKQAERVATLKAMRKDCQDEIVRLTALLAQRSVPAVGALDPTPQVPAPDVRYAGIIGASYARRFPPWP